MFSFSLAPVRSTLASSLSFISLCVSRAHTYCPRPYLSLSLSLPLSLTVLCPYDEECRQRSNRSLAFACAASLLHPSAIREPALPLLLSISPRFSLSLFPLPRSPTHLPPLPPPPAQPSPLLSPTLSSDLLYHIRHQHYTRALISSVGNSAFLAISLLLLYHPLTPTLSPSTLSPRRARLCVSSASPSPPDRHTG